MDSELWILNCTPTGMSLIMSLLTSLPEASSLLLVGTALIIAGALLRRVFYAVEKGLPADSKQNP